MQELYEKKGYLLENFRLFHLREEVKTEIDYHYHEFYKLFFLISGNGGYSVEGKRYLLHSGDVVLIGSHHVHRPEFENGMPYERIIIYISPDFLQQQSSPDCDLTECFSGSRGHVLRPGEKLRQLLLSFALDLEHELSDSRYGRTILCNSILLRLLVEISRSIHSHDVQTPAPLLPKSKRILDIVRYIDTHLTEELTIDDLADRFYLSRYHMMRRFREETGTTIHAYLSERRLLLARDLITQGVPATDACFQCGYRSYASFSRAYGNFFGTTPTGRKNSSSVMEETYE